MTTTVELCRSLQTPCEEQATREVALSHLPTLVELETQMRKAKRGKAADADLLPGELFHADAAGMSKILYPQILKSAAHAQPPFKQKVSALLLDTLRAWRAPQQHYGKAALVPNVAVATRTHGQDTCSVAV